MASEVIEIMASLSAVMREETARLQASGRGPDLAELASVKARLVGALEERLARMNRQQPDWPGEMDEDTRTVFAEALGELRAASMVNAALLERQIELSADVMSAISAEARRVSGNRAFAYGATGTLARSDLATPIALNSEF
ncbi:flagellar biosynthesis protein FlgN [Novosphingobium sp. FGD1]|uniref:Flagellar biosynthesis protein FlgN n=1 Tax=Novosphingobium silvae TaxID=2692619 RepID=A0A7X4GJ73_9SPHN|nr:flagellar biosynthesis protein FlgN [Novosphingobium silvae]MYL99305.1 flagellar biosynthesis protein FlgN [Novosphingobium silvae]